jgi:phosphatidylserine/phosphatidylglycerophosphate/cardiolipin synthase-like enzyme
MLIVDDEIMSVGSCNKNNRGVIYEGEANLLIRDSWMVAESRQHEFARLVGPEYAHMVADPTEAFELLRELAAYNDSVYAVWDDAGGKLATNKVTDNHRPRGLVYGLVVPMNWWFDPGPDFY